MKPIATDYKSNGFQYKQMIREGRVAIYEQKNIEHVALYYEVLVIRKRKACKVCNTYMPKSEIYPKSSQWGKFGFTFSKNNIDLAHLKFAELDEIYNKEEIEEQELSTGEITL